MRSDRLLFSSSFSTMKSGIPTSTYEVRSQGQGSKTAKRVVGGAESER